jgi:acyl dehydratase
VRYEDVELGDELPDRTPDVSIATIARFCQASRMVFGRFMDHEKARKEGLPGAIVPGIMSQGILAAMIHDWAPGCSIEKLDTVFRAPILVDSAPVCRAVVTDTDDETRTLEVDLTIVNEAGETRVMGTATVSLE